MRKINKLPEIVPDAAPLFEEEVFDEDGDIPDNDEQIIGANNGADDEEEHETYLQGDLFGYVSPIDGAPSSHAPLCCCGHCNIPVIRFERTVCDGR